MNDTNSDAGSTSSRLTATTDATERGSPRFKPDPALMAKAPPLNPSHWYRDDDITAILTAAKGRPAMHDGEPAAYLTERKAGDAFIAVTPAVDRYKTNSTPVDYFLDKEKQPAPNAGYRDDRRDAVEEVMAKLAGQNEGKAKILMPYNIVSQTHWAACAISIKKNDNDYRITVKTHDPYGGGKMPDADFALVRNALERGIRRADAGAAIAVSNEESKYRRPRQAEKDNTSCGVVAVEDIIRLMHGKAIDDSQVQPRGAEELRRRHIERVKGTSRKRSADDDASSVASDDSLEEEEEEKLTEEQLFAKGIWEKLFDKKKFRVKALEDEDPATPQAEFEKQVYDVLLTVRRNLTKNGFPVSDVETAAAEIINLLRLTGDGKLNETALANLLAEGQWKSETAFIKQVDASANAWTPTAAIAAKEFVSTFHKEVFSPLFAATGMPLSGFVSGMIGDLGEAAATFAGQFLVLGHIASTCCKRDFARQAEARKKIETPPKSVPAKG
jgi:hypothetical protein